MLFPLISAVKAHTGLELDLIVSGGHFVSGLGGSLEEIRKDGFEPSFEIKPPLDGLVNSECAKVAKSVGGYVAGKADKAGKTPGFFVVLGDRPESFAAAGAAFLAGCVLVHIAGGDTTQGGMRDDSLRHAISKLAHIHLPFCAQSAENLKSLGEEPWRVKCFGSPAVDNFMRVKKSGLVKTLRAKHGVPENKPYALITQHPVTGCEGQAAKHMLSTLKAVEKSGVFGLVTAPNHDGGWQGIVEVINAFAQKPGFKVVKNLGRDDYLGLMLGAGAVVGNSSSGILESPIAKVPCVNIGNRQSGRGAGANIISVGHNQAEIEKAIRTAVFDEGFLKKAKNVKHPFGSGKSGEKTAQLLARIEISGKLFNKQHKFKKSRTR